MSIENNRSVREIITFKPTKNRFPVFHFFFLQIMQFGINQDKSYENNQIFK